MFSYLDMPQLQYSDVDYNIQQLLQSPEAF